MINNRQQEYISNLARSKLRDLRPESVAEMKNPQGQIEVLGLPDMAEVVPMGHKERIYTLRMCPASQYFGAPKSEINEASVPKKEAIRLVIAMVKAHTQPSLEAIPECSSSQESEKGSECQVSFKSLKQMQDVEAPQFDADAEDDKQHEPIDLIRNVPK